jgi:hypothetical protein
MDTLKSWTELATAWVTNNPTEVVYAAAILTGIAVLSSLGGSRR